MKPVDDAVPDFGETELRASLGFGGTREHGHLLLGNTWEQKEN